MASPYFADRSDNDPLFEPGPYAQGGHVIIGWKATEGTGFVDGTHAGAVAKAREHGIGVLHYHFCRPDDHPDGAGEIVSFAARVGPHLKPWDRIALDFERTHPNGIAAANAYLHGLSHACVERMRALPLIYMSTSWFNEHGPGCLLPGQQIWLADYNPARQLPYWARDYWAWQKNDGHVGGGPFNLAGVGLGDVNLLSGGALRRLNRDRVTHRVFLR